MKLFTKDPSSILDYEWDWVAWLGIDTIAEISLVGTEGLAINSFLLSEGKITVWISGGTIKHTGMVTCTIVTTGGRTDSRSALFYIDDK